MQPYYEDGKGIVIYHGDCREVAPTLEGATAIVSDPPYGLSFMGKDWDHGIPGKPFWEAIDQACLPGAMLLAFGGTRTYHRLVCAIEDAGFEIRDCIQWIYGSGFPKSLDISKAIDKAAGAEQEVVGQGRPRKGIEGVNPYHATSDTQATGHVLKQPDITTPSTEHAKTWNGYGTALKPAHEPICVAMKPLSGTYAQNAIEHGVAGINVDGCRVGTEKRSAAFTSFAPCHGNALGKPGTAEARRGTQGEPKEYTGRWPANIIHDGSEEVVRLFPETTTNATGPPKDYQGRQGDVYGDYSQTTKTLFYEGNSGSAVRFFYCAKASDREIQQAEDFPLWGESHESVKNTHPTVKPLALMEYLIKLVTMPGRNLILEPFMGSGTTLVACKQAGIPAIGIEREEKYCEIAADRLKQACKGIDSATPFA